MVELIRYVIENKSSDPRFSPVHNMNFNCIGMNFGNEEFLLGLSEFEIALGLSTISKLDKCDKQTRRQMGVICFSKYSGLSKYADTHPSVQSVNHLIMNNEGNDEGLNLSGIYSIRGESRSIIVSTRVKELIRDLALLPDITEPVTTRLLEDFLEELAKNDMRANLIKQTKEQLFNAQMITEPVYMGQIEIKKF